MKNLSKIIAMSLTIMTGLTSCKTFDGDGIITKETRKIDVFNEISMPISAEVIVKQAAFPSLEIEGEANIIKILRTEVRNGKLYLSFDQNWVRTTSKLKIYVSTPTLSYVYVSGSGNVISDNRIVTENLTLNLSGSGTIDVAADVRKKLTLKHIGSGLIFAEGNTKNLDVNFSGSGEVQAFKMIADNVDVNLSGSGVCETNAQNNLYVNISGSGDVYFKGNPSVRKFITGSGRLFIAK